MAYVEAFELGKRSSIKRQQSSVICYYHVAKHDEVRLIQLDTLGSGLRANPGKQSQTLPLDAERAKQRVEILKAAFDLDG